ncbi:MAG: hypothetical protein J5858_15530 [Lentisphaeria bacterium]|nr:hypothetical protein [Lentisphaeria bacterium]
MNRGRYTPVPDPAIETVLKSAIEGIAGEIETLHLPKLRAVVLGGGYGRGEGGVRHTPDGGKPYNDLDLFVFSEDADPGEAARIDRSLKKLAEPWEKKLGIAVDFGPVKNLDSLKSVSHTLMFQELLRGWQPVWGHAELEQWIPALEASDLPYSEAVRLLLNRGMGLVLAGDFLKGKKDDADFIVRNMNKAVLGGADAQLIASGNYRWSGRDRVTAFADHVRREKLPAEYAVFYEKAFRWKLEPEPVLPADPAGAWGKCRSFFMDSVCLCAGVSPGSSAPEIADGLHHRVNRERSLKNALRWLVRSKTLRRPGMFFDPPVVTVLSMLYAELAKTNGFAEPKPQLYQLWRIFN